MLHCSQWWNSTRKKKFSWSGGAPARVFVKRGPAYFRRLFTVLFLLAAVAVFFKEFMLAAVLAALGFLLYQLGTVPPGSVRHQITNHGVKTHGHEYLWDELEDFWFSEDGGQTTLHVDTKHLFPGRLFLLLSGKVGREAVGKVLKSYLPYHKKPHRDILDHLAFEFSRRFRLE